MQFAGQRTDLDLNVIGEPHNMLIKLTEDVLPDPAAILVTGITPQQTQAEGITEEAFLRQFNDEVAIPGTIFVGFNSVRFDDEFMRYSLYRNLYDPYQWQWKDERSRWDLLDVVRMTRALRPEGIVWPVDEDNKSVNKLTMLTAANKLDHANAHDALSDVLATIDLARLLRDKQPKLFNYLLSMRDKDKIKELVRPNQKFVYSSGKYPAEFEKTTIVTTVAEHPQGGALVYDLRHDPTPFLKMSVDELVEAWQWRPIDPTQPERLRLPIKTLKFNRCPAVAPLSVIQTDSETQQRLKLDMKTIEANAAKLSSATDWPKRLEAAREELDAKQAARWQTGDESVDAQLYDGFFNGADQQVMQKLHAASPDELGDFASAFGDARLRELVPLFKARNYPDYLTEEEHEQWEAFKTNQLLSGGSESRLAKFFETLGEMSKQKDLSDEHKYLLEELRLYGESITPTD